ncbi:MAG: 5-formyltetrahydrofolate cyclo-ligase [Porphyromonadaceae bacterium]|nr:5-formyltetrahydrofolate cyclo-ligase [Porphyromonadaceae bacterium]MDD6313783.1 5-formyltetrahydrofolate cyclo-ligase [Porphyromonadaceae bacterium]
MEKSDLRRKIKAMRLMLSDDDKSGAAEQVFSQLEKCAAFLLADKILMYHSLPDELSTIAFLDKWGTKKHFYLPRVNGVNLDILPYDRSRLELGAFHIEEPVGDELTDPAEIELIVVPAVAYDRRGNRLGRGKGFYDRLLSTTKATKIGVGYDFQLVDEIDVEPHDIPMDMVITQTEVLLISK